MQEERKRRKRSDHPFSLKWLAIAPAILGLLAWIAFFLQANGVPQRQFDRGEELFFKGQYERAVRNFRRLHDQHPHNSLAPRALLQAGEILYLHLGREREALLTYLLVQRDYPGSPEDSRAQQRAAEIYKYRLEDYDRALTAYQKLLDNGDSEGENFQYEIADIYFRRNHFEQARIEFEHYLKRYPDSERLDEVLFRVASIHALEGSLKQAATTFKRLAEHFPDSPFHQEALYGLAMVREETGELRAALDLLERLRKDYHRPEVLELRMDQIRQRMEKKRKAI